MYYILHIPSNTLLFRYLDAPDSASSPLEFYSEKEAHRVLVIIRRLVKRYNNLVSITTNKSLYKRLKFSSTFSSFIRNHNKLTALSLPGTSIDPFLRYHVAPGTFPNRTNVITFMGTIAPLCHILNISLAFDEYMTFNLKEFAIIRK